jgi:hypothetical protein
MQKKTAFRISLGVKAAAIVFFAIFGVFGMTDAIRDYQDADLISRVHGAQFLLTDEAFSVLMVIVATYAIVTLAFEIYRQVKSWK